MVGRAVIATRLRRGRPAVCIVLALLIVGVPAAAAGGPCTDTEPCAVTVTVGPAGLQSAEPTRLATDAVYVLHVVNDGNASANVTVVGTRIAALAPPNGSADSQPFAFAQATAVHLREATTNTTLALQVVAPPSATVRDSSLLAVLLPVLVGLALIGIAYVVVRSGRAHRHNLFFAGLYMLSGLKSISEGLSARADSFHAQASLFPAATFWDHLGTYCALGILPLLFLFVSTFPRPARWMQQNPRLGLLAVVPSLIVAVLLIGYERGALSPELFLSAAQGFNVLFVAVTLSAVVLLLRVRRESRDAVERTQAAFVLLGFVPSFVMGWIVSGVQLAEEGRVVSAATAEAVIGVILHYLSPVFEFVACALVGMAILKYNILGISPRFRLGVKSAVAGLLFIGLFLVTQFVENVILQGKVFAFAGQYGSFLLSGITGLVLFKPIERASDKVSNRLLPGATAQASGDSSAALLHAEQIYHAQATYVLRDAKVTDRELAFLTNLRQQLGLSDEQARRIEEQVERVLKVDDPRTGHKATGTPGAGTAKAAAAARQPAGAVEVRQRVRAPSIPTTKRGPKAVPAPPAKAGTGRPAAAKPAAKAPASPSAAGGKSPRKAGGTKETAPGKAAGGAKKGAPPAKAGKPPRRAT